jgi:cytochrome P450
MPAFSFRHIKDLYPVFWAKGAEMVEALTAQIPKNPVVEIGGWASRATLDIIGLAGNKIIHNCSRKVDSLTIVSGMGHDFHAIQNPETELSQTYNKVFSPAPGQQIFMLLSFILPTWFLTNLPVKRNEDIFIAADTIKRTCRELIHQKRINMEKKEQVGIDILSVAMESGLFTDEQLVNQMMTFLAAGHETTASATQWAVYALAKDQRMQDKLREEIRANLPSISDSSAIITASQIDEHLPYLHAVCNEVLRFHSPVPLTLREAAHDTSIQGHPVPAGTKIILSPWAVNHSKELWGEDAGQFKPERWIGQGKANTGGSKSNYAFLTFLHGPRSCIGQGFAKAEFACLLAGIVGKFKFELVDPDEELEIKSGITARPKNGVNVRMQVVDGW